LAKKLSAENVHSYVAFGQVVSNNGDCSVSLSLNAYTNKLILN